MQMADVDDSGSIAVIANQLSDFIYGNVGWRNTLRHDSDREETHAEITD